MVPCARILGGRAPRYEPPSVHGGGSERLNDTPVVHLIRAIIETPRRATAAEVEQITERIASAPFEAVPIHVPQRLRVMYQGRVLSNREPSPLVHFVKRTLVEEQWDAATTIDDYILDLRRAALTAGAQLLAYTRWGDRYAATITPTRQVIPDQRLGRKACPNLLVVYSADRSVIVTGYMFTELSDLNLPGDVLWLR
jgi:hypothetical protein